MNYIKESSVSKVSKLDELEAHELLRIMYPDHFRSDEDCYYELSQDVVEQEVSIGNGEYVTLSEFISRLSMLTPTIYDDYRKVLYTGFGELSEYNGKGIFLAVVKRSVYSAD